MTSSDWMIIVNGSGSGLETKKVSVGDLFNGSTLTSNVSFGNTALFVDTLNKRISINGMPYLTNKFSVYGDSFIDGNIFATGKITVQGDLEIGNTDTDKVTFNADISSSLIPLTSNTYNFGTTTKYWNDLFIKDVYVKRDIDVIRNGIFHSNVSITGNTTIGKTLDVGQTLDVTGNTILWSDLAVNGGDMTTNQTTFNILNNTATTINAFGAATTLNIGVSGGNATFNSNLIVTGDLTVNGTTTTINATTLVVTDKNIEIGKVTTPTNITANGGGITLHGATDKTIIWDSANSNWSSSEDWNLLSSKVFKINNVSVLSSTTLGSTITGSSLTSVGTITSGTWSGNFGAVSGSNLTSLTAGNLSGTIPSGVLGNSTVYIGTTAVLLNRISGALALTGITSIDGNAATATTSTNQSGGTVSATTGSFSGVVTHSISTGTAPFSITSTTVNTNLNADLLDGQHGSYFAPIAAPDFTGNHIGIPSGATSARPTGATGYFRFNTDLISFEGYNGTSWGSVGGGATGGGTDHVFVENDIHVTTSYTITSGKNAHSAGPITIDSGAVVTIPTGSVWIIS